MGPGKRLIITCYQKTLLLSDNIISNNKTLYDNMMLFDNILSDNTKVSEEMMLYGIKLSDLFLSLSQEASHAHHSLCGFSQRRVCLCT
jgi:hypothetical protein